MWSKTYTKIRPVLKNNNYIYFLKETALKTDIKKIIAAIKTIFAKLFIVEVSQGYEYATSSEYATILKTSLVLNMPKF